MARQYNPLRRLKGSVSDYLPAFQSIARVNRFDLTRLKDLQNTAEIYILTVKPIGGAPTKRGIKHVGPNNFIPFLKVIEAVNRLDMKLPKDRAKCVDILKRSIDSN